MKGVAHTWQSSDCKWWLVRLRAAAMWHMRKLSPALSFICVTKFHEKLLCIFSLPPLAANIVLRCLTEPSGSGRRVGKVFRFEISDFVCCIVSKRRVCKSCSRRESNKKCLNFIYRRAYRLRLQINWISRFHSALRSQGTPRETIPLNIIPPEISSMNSP